MIWILLGLPVVLIASVLGSMLYNVCLHPLRAYPGPKLWAASRLPWIWYSCNGQVHTKILELHKKFGGIVRIAPNELSYTTGDAWKQIYGHRSPEMMKDLRGAGILPTFKGTDSIITAAHKDHIRMRRTVAYAFSEKALREQEHLLQGYVDLMISRLKDKCSECPQNLVNWYNWCTFDMMGDLTFAEPFGCLKEGQYHNWVRMIFDGVKAYPWVQAAVYYNLIWFVNWVTPKHLAEAKRNADANAYAKLDRRLEKKDLNRKDFMSYILRHNDEKGLSLPEMQETAVILIIAGSETTATFLSGATYYILRHPAVYTRLVREIRHLFSNYEDITMVKTNELKYLPAIVEETFRIYPPSPNAFPRIVPGKGEWIEGRWVPGNTTVGVNQYSASRDPRNFFEPEKFLPERWLPQSMHAGGDLPAENFAADQKQVVQPFSFGPRNCIGRNLAYAELQLILSKLLWTFDLQLAPDCDNGTWATKQPTYMLWEKPELNVILTPVKR
ncbi:uncharacterized protein Z518_04674 [Rhinocladiella mackenziei CBS 650.93]|uniref:Cytochrome P450 monooxygenase n=1 Tax=Rhinocladiella mackenziei CBS 650.93 TaxID=1442369 RepID=A0A0D2H8C6_9EURO|nr:uncharacterized protein Z518_04674 [Rhinocladiella mackenziei CBS 650.93]KIX06698.1 hypothetical protein Z518_04674 [Rhinocladiella mackenziei CBS 650.93]